jgi:hypothetical protein
MRLQSTLDAFAGRLTFFFISAFLSLFSVLGTDATGVIWHRYVIDQKKMFPPFSVLFVFLAAAA